MASVLDPATLIGMLAVLQLASAVLFISIVRIYKQDYMKRITLGSIFEALGCFFIVLQVVDGISPFITTSLGNVLLVSGGLIVASGFLLSINIYISRKNIFIYSAVIFTTFTLQYFSHATTNERIISYSLLSFYYLFLVIYNFIKTDVLIYRRLKFLTIGLYGLYALSFVIRSLKAWQSPAYTSVHSEGWTIIMYALTAMTVLYIRSVIIVMITANHYQKELQYLSMTDELTGLNNNRAIINQLNTELTRSRRSHHPLTIAMIDIDNFKKLNDSYGHVFGDEVLKRFAEIANDHLRDCDQIGRYGGEEFLLIFPETDGPSAVNAIQRIMDGLRQEAWRYDDVTVTFSTGIKEISGDMFQVDSRHLIDDADQNLYKSKAAGKDRISC